MTESHPQLWAAGPVAIRPTSHKRGAPPIGKTCREPGCTKTRRLAQGARYCEDHARSIGYELQHQGRLGAPTVRTCRCGREFTIRNAARMPTRDAWNEYCPHCHNETPLTLVQLRGHRVPPEQVRTWLACGAQLRCDLCGKTLTRRHKGSRPIIEHRHSCCPGGSSCGQCVRGVVCVKCNTMLAYAEAIDEADLWAKIRSYLQ